MTLRTIPFQVGHLSDVDTTTPPVDAQALVWDATAERWVPANPSVNDLSDVDTSTDPPALGEVLVWDGAAWVPGASDSPETIKNLGRWEVVVSGVPAEAVTNEAGDDWLYTWTED